GVGREAGEEEDLGGGEAVDEGLLAVDERDPLAAAVGGAVAGPVEAGDVEGAPVEQVGVRRRAAREVGDVVGDELVEVVEALVVTGVDDGSAVVRDGGGAGLVLEAAQGG